MRDTAEMSIIRSLVRTYPRANLTLEQVFTLDHAKVYLKQFDSDEPPTKLDGSSDGDGHR